METETELTNRWETKFGKWVDRVGVARLIRELEARGLSYGRVGVYAWVKGSTPKPETVLALVEIAKALGPSTKMKLTLEDVLEHSALVENLPGKDPFLGRPPMKARA